MSNEKGWEPDELAALERAPSITDDNRKWLATVAAARLEGVRLGLEAAAKAAEGFDSHRTCEPMCGCSEDIAEAIRSLDAEAVAKEPE